MGEVTPCVYANSVGVAPANVNVFVPEFVKAILPVRVRVELFRTLLFNCVCRADVTPLKYPISVGVAPENL